MTFPSRPTQEEREESSSNTNTKASLGVRWLWGQARAFSSCLPSETPFTPTCVFLVTAFDGQVLTPAQGGSLSRRAWQATPLSRKQFDLLPPHQPKISFTGQRFSSPVPFCTCSYCTLRPPSARRPSCCFGPRRPQCSVFTPVPGSELHAVSRWGPSHRPPSLGVGRGRLWFSALWGQALRKGPKKENSGHLPMRFEVLWGTQVSPGSDFFLSGPMCHEFFLFLSCKLTSMFIQALLCVGGLIRVRQRSSMTSQPLS